ncbi:MAG: hypothetical protein KF788_08645 [Piscinibacter sp.]|nr:hypothetical protein [Piscinibacter sp.]
MSDGQLVGQELAQQGAINVIAWLLKQGCTEANAAAALDSLRVNAQLLREEKRRRGGAPLFTDDQTEFN